MLRQFEVGSSVNRTVHLPLGHGKQLRAARGYKHLSAMVAATLRFDPEVAAKATATSKGKVVEVVLEPVPELVVELVLEQVV